jgi:predicted dehydrogenase
LIGVWGRDESKANDIGARWGATGYSEVDALLADVDAVAIALPPAVQAPLAVRAADAGRHLLLEKPIALDLAAANRIEQAVARSGVSSVVFFTLRFRPQVAAWLDAAVGQGGWQGATGRWLAGGTFDEGSPWATSQWRKEYGAIWDLTPHLLSVAVPLLGEVTGVSAERGSADVAHLVLTHAGGVTSALTVAQALAPPVEATDFELYGGPGRSAMPDDPATPVESFQRAVAELERSVDSGEPSALDVRLGRHVVAVIEAAVKARDSAAEHRARV